MNFTTMVVQQLQEWGKGQLRKESSYLVLLSAGLEKDGKGPLLPAGLLHKKQSSHGVLCSTGCQLADFQGSATGKEIPGQWPFFTLQQSAASRYTQLLRDGPEIDV